MKAESIHLASTHRAFDTRIFQKECRTLALAGHPVTYIVPHHRHETIEGVRIRAVPIPKDGKERLSRTLTHIYQAALEESPEAVYHFHDAELIFHMFALKRGGRRVVYDAHEDTPKQVMYQHWIPALLRPVVARVMQAAEWFGGSVFDGVIAAEPGILQRFPAAKRALVHNYPLRDELIRGEAIPYTERPARIAYVGAITEVRGLREMLAALHSLPATLNAELVLGGPFHPPDLQTRMHTLPGAERVEARGWLTRDEVATLLGHSRAGIVTIHPTEKYLASYPTKLFEYMSAGLPVIASNFPGWRRFVEASRCGLLVDPLDPDAIASAMRWILEHPREAEAMGKRGQEAVRTQFNWEQEAQTLLAFYRRFQVREGTSISAHR